MSPSPRDSADDKSHDDSRKRVAKACDRCRLKKIKCDGRIPCTRCKTENAVCRFGDRRKTIERRVPPGYVEYLEEQQRVLVAALKITYKAMPQADSLPSDLSIHAILESLGVLEASHHSTVLNSPFHFEEDVDKLRDRWDDHADACSDSHSHTSLSQSSFSPELTFASTGLPSAPEDLRVKAEYSPVPMASPNEFGSRPGLESSDSLSSASDFSIASPSAFQPQPNVQQQQAWMTPLSTEGPHTYFHHYPSKPQPQPTFDIFPHEDMQMNGLEYDSYHGVPMTVAPSMLQGQPLKHPAIMGDVDVQMDESAWRRWRYGNQPSFTLPADQIPAC